MKKIDKILNKLNYIWIIVIMLYIFISSIFILYGKLGMVKYSNIFYILNIITLILCLLNYIKKGKFNFIDFIILGLIVIASLTTYLSEYRTISLWGHNTRCEGMVMLITYYLLFLLGTFIEEKDKKKVIFSILFFGVLQVGIGILQQLKIMPGASYVYVKGLAGNSNFYSTQNIMWLSLSLGLFIFSKKWLYIVLILIFSIGLTLGGAMSCFVGLICVLLSILFIIIYNRKNIEFKEYLKRYLTSIFLMIILFIVVSILIDGTLIKDIKELLFQSSDIIVNHNIKEDYGTSRILIWKKTIPKIGNYLIKGIGIDCFRYIFNPLLINNNTIVSKAHNEYLQYLITEGIYCLIFYLMLLFMCIHNNFKRIKTKGYNYFDYAILLCVIGYITQAFFNISVIRVAPIFYVVLGLCYKRDNLRID